MARTISILFRLRIPATKIKIIIKIIILLSLLFLASCQSQNKSATIPSDVKLARVVSGQTLEVLGMETQPNLTSQIRLIGLDAPDLGQTPWGEDAKKTLETLIGGVNQSLKLEFDLENKDKFNRTLAYVWKDQLLLNEEIIKQGYALFVARSPNNKYNQRLKHAQQWARIMGKGIWNPDQPMRITPGEYRRLYR
jgi:micrococcal nuclease